MFCENCGRDNGEDYTICPGCGNPKPGLFSKKQEYYKISDNDAYQGTQINTIDITSALQPSVISFPPAAEIPKPAPAEPEAQSLKETGKLPPQLEEMMPSPVKKNEGTHNFPKNPAARENPLNTGKNIPPASETNTETAVLWGILGFFIPLAGFILFLLKRETDAKTARYCLIAAIIGALLCSCSCGFLGLFN